MPEPLNTRKRQQPQRAYATYALILAQLAVWLVVRLYLLSGNDWLYFALLPEDPSLLGFLVSPFLHLEGPHLGLNLLVLWLFGPTLERAIGSVPFLLLYLGSAWFASLMHWAAATAFQLRPDLRAEGAALGASGAISGVLGGCVVRFTRFRLTLPFLPRLSCPAAPLIAAWLGYTLVRALLTTVHGITEGVGHWAHLAGFVFGLGTSQLAGYQHSARAEYLQETALEATRRKDHETASRAWAALLALHPDNPDVRAALISERMAAGDLTGAHRLAREGLTALARQRDGGKSADAYRLLHLLVPNLSLPPGVRYRIGCCLAEAGDIDLAYQAWCESAVEDENPTAAAHALFRAGQLAWERMMDADKARAAWKRLLEAFPDSEWIRPAQAGMAKLPPPT